MLAVIRRFVGAAVLCSVVACSSMGGGAVVVYGTAFLSTPTDVSSAWVDDSGRIVMVPAKGVVIDSIHDQGKSPVSFTESGPYIVLGQKAVSENRGRSLWLMIEGKAQRFDIPSSSGEGTTYSRLDQRQ